MSTNGGDIRSDQNVFGQGATKRKGKNLGEGASEKAPDRPLSQKKKSQNVPKGESAYTIKLNKLDQG